MHGIVAAGGGGACDVVLCGWFWVVVAGGGSCGGGVVGVLFSKSPRGRPAEMLGTGGGQSPKFQDRIWSAFCALRVRVGRVGWFAGRGNADLQSGPDSGKFEKLLRSDPRPKWLWWCRVCLLFENSIVCQVC